MFLGLTAEKWLAFLGPVILALIAGIFGAKFRRNKRIHKIGNITGSNNQVINGDANRTMPKDKDNA